MFVHRQIASKDRLEKQLEIAIEILWGRCSLFSSAAHSRVHKFEQNLLIKRESWLQGSVSDGCLYNCSIALLICLSWKAETGLVAAIFVVATLLDKPSECACRSTNFITYWNLCEKLIICGFFWILFLSRQDWFETVFQVIDFVPMSECNLQLCLQFAASSHWHIQNINLRSKKFNKSIFEKISTCWIR